MKTAALHGSMFLLLALILVGCGSNTSSNSANPANPGGTTSAIATTKPGAQVTLEVASFVQSMVRLPAGTALRLLDPAATGGLHMLCYGRNQICAQTATGSAIFASPGYRISAGDPPKDVLFTTAGTYEITCTLHPLMNLTVVVQ